MQKISESFKKQNKWRFEPGYKFDVYEREILKDLIDNLDKLEILGLIGARQVGKSSLLYLLIQHLIKTGTKLEDIFYFNLDELSLHELFSSSSSFLDFIRHNSESETKKYVFLDEIQRLENPGLFLKTIYDLRENIKIICSGSSQLEIKSKIKENLVGRFRSFYIPRLRFEDSLRMQQPITREECFSRNLVYGSYPKVVINPNTEDLKLVLKDIYDLYIQKDITEFLQVSKPDSFNKLIILLAQQIGSLLNLDSLASALRINRETVERYISILEDTFIIKLVNPFYQNYKKEIIKSKKIYFLDLGLRNYALGNFETDLELRDDKGALFENFCFLEFLAADTYGLSKINFWRTTNQTEIDFVLRSDSGLQAIETKWQTTPLPKSFKTFSKHYPKAEQRLISKEDFLNSSVKF